MPTIELGPVTLVPGPSRVCSGTARWLRGDGTGVSFSWKLSLREAGVAGLGAQELDLAAVRRALTYALAVRGPVPPPRGESLTITAHDVRAAVESGRAAPLQEQVLDVLESTGAKAWHVTAASVVPGEVLQGHGEFYLRQEDALLLGGTLPQPVPGTRIWEVRAFGRLLYFGAQLAGAHPERELLEVPLVRASHARVLGQIL